jgi:HSP20 family protein
MSILTLRTRRFDPFADFSVFVPNFSGFGSPTRRSFTPAAEVTRDGDDAVVQVELPGIDVTKDVTVEIVDHSLVLRGERRDERAEEKNGQVLREVRYGSFRRAFRLPEHVTSDALTATYDAGVLRVRVAGAYTGSDAKRIPVTAGSAPAVEAGSDEQPTT